MRTNLPCFTPRRSYVTLNRRTKLQWYLMWDWFYANDSLSCFPDVCPITANMEEGALRPGIPSAAPVMASGTPELPVTPVCINRPVILVTPFSHSYAMCFKFPSQHLACSTAQQVVEFFFFFFLYTGPPTQYYAVGFNIMVAQCTLPCAYVFIWVSSPPGLSCYQVMFLIVSRSSHHN